VNKPISPLLARNSDKEWFCLYVADFISRGMFRLPSVCNCERYCAVRPTVKRYPRTIERWKPHVATIYRSGDIWN